MLTPSRASLLALAALALAARAADVRPVFARAPVVARQQVDGDGYDGKGFTVQRLLADEPPATAILIHGLGGSGQEWGFLSLALSFFSLNYVKFIIPSAANRSVTYLDDTLPSWFDIRSIGEDSVDVNRFELLQSVDRIDRIIAGEIRQGVPADRIFLIGFSQGGALALTTYLRSKPGRTIAGCVGVATFLPLDSEYRRGGNFTVNVGGDDVLMIHGTADEAVDLKFGRLSAERIEEATGTKVNFTEIEGAPHIILSERVLNLIEDFIKERASGTTNFLKLMVSNLTRTFSSWTDDLSLRTFKIW